MLHIGGDDKDRAIGYNFLANDFVENFNVRGVFSLRGNEFTYTKSKWPTVSMSPYIGTTVDLLWSLINSHKMYLFEFYPVKDVLIKNCDNVHDERFNWLERKPDYKRPPEGYDGYVFVNSSAQFVNMDNRDPVSLIALVFHELSENFFRVESELKYIDAHKKALEREIALKYKWPTFTQCLAGVEGLICANCKYKQDGSLRIKETSWVKAKIRGLLNKGV